MDAYSLRGCPGKGFRQLSANLISVMVSPFGYVSCDKQVLLSSNLFTPVIIIRKMYATSVRVSHSFTAYVVIRLELEG